MTFLCNFYETKEGTVSKGERGGTGGKTASRRKRDGTGNGVDLGFRIIRIPHVRIPCRRLSDLSDPLKVSLDGGLVHPGEYNTICLALGRGIFTIQMRQFHRCTGRENSTLFRFFLCWLLQVEKRKVKVENCWEDRAITIIGGSEMRTNHANKRRNHRGLSSFA